MKDYQKLLKEYDGSNTVFIKHEWGQNIASLYNRVAEAWNKVDMGTKVIITSNLSLGIKRAVKFFESKDLAAKIVGKGPEGLRLVELQKDKSEILEAINTQELISFDFNGREYEVNVGNAIFSKTDLDAGTRFLLEVVFSSETDFNDMTIGDFGSGWGAIALVIATEFPKAKVFAYEKDKASIEVSRVNLSKRKNVSIFEADLTQASVELKENQLDYIVSNPPFHIGENDREMIFKNAQKMLKRNGKLFFVAEGSFVERFSNTAKKFFTIANEQTKGRYSVFECANHKK